MQELKGVMQFIYGAVFGFVIGFGVGLHGVLVDNEGIFEFNEGEIGSV